MKIKDFFEKGETNLAGVTFVGAFVTEALRASKKLLLDLTAFVGAIVESIAFVDSLTSNPKVIMSSKQKFSQFLTSIFLDKTGGAISIFFSNFHLQIQGILK